MQRSSFIYVSVYGSSAIASGQIAQVCKSSNKCYTWSILFPLVCGFADHFVLSVDYFPKCKGKKLNIQETQSTEENEKLQCLLVINMERVEMSRWHTVHCHPSRVYTYIKNISISVTKLNLPHVTQISSPPKIISFFDPAETQKLCVGNRLVLFFSTVHYILKSLGGSQSSFRFRKQLFYATNALQRQTKLASTVYLLTLSNIIHHHINSYT